VQLVGELERLDAVARLAHEFEALGAANDGARS
jgi:hypothetical protein